MRLVRLLDSPRDIPILAPVAEREILYRLLIGPQGARLRQIAVADSRLQQVGRAISWLKHNFREPFRIEDLAKEARMSASALHQHFKTVTSMSPLQFQKQLRLQEARRLILAQAMDAALAGHSVGYDSPSQFSREYRRLFGAPPIRDVQRLRASEAPLYADGLSPNSLLPAELGNSRVRYEEPCIAAAVVSIAASAELRRQPERERRHVGHQHQHRHAGAEERPDGAHRLADR